MRATVTIQDATGAPVAAGSVTVVVTVPGGSQTTITRATNTQGRASFSTQATASGTYTFTVTGVTVPSSRAPAR